MIVDAGTRYVIECREPHVGEWVMLPGPIYTYITNPRDTLCQQACQVVIGTLAIGLGPTGELVYDVRPMPDMVPGGAISPEPVPYDFGVVDTSGL